MNLKEKVVDGVSKVKSYWKTPPKGRYMTFREIAAYSGGGIGAYMIITLGNACLLSTNNTLLGGVLGVAPIDMYIMYVLAVLANIPLTAVRANIIDNTRNKAGKYRPYIVTMAIPSAIICITMVYFPYDSFGALFGTGELFGKTFAYISKCAVIMILNFLLQFIYYFFYDGYENLIHVLSPNTQERADVASVKSIVYSFAPTVVNLFTPIIAEHIFKSNTTDIRVYRLLYPILAVLGILLCIVVYKYTEEKIVQARTHVVQIKFMDALRAVAKNKYFWIISLAGWIGFLESAYANILYWLYNYGGACDGDAYGLITLLYGNASLWGMLAAPFCIRKWGKKKVLIVTNFFNIVFILSMLLFTKEITPGVTIWLVMVCLWFNALMGSFAHILNPSIQADIRDYQQYQTGERIDGMFSAINTIGTVLALATSSVLPFIYEKKGITAENAKVVTSDPNVLNRLLGDGKTTVGEILAKQFAEGQNNYVNPNSALYDPDILLSLINVLILVAAFGALMNVIPYFWYDFNERKQQSVVRVLRVRAMYEDYGNGALKDENLVEGVDIIRNAREMAVAEPKVLDKKSYKGISDKAQKKAAKKAYNADKQFNEDIEIAKFVCDELDKFSNPVYYAQLEQSRRVFSAGLAGLLDMNINEINAEISAARAMPKTDAASKEARSKAIEIAKNKKLALKEIRKNFSNPESFVQPDFEVLERYFDEEDECDDILKKLYQEKALAKKAKDYVRVGELKDEINAVEEKRKTARKNSKAEMDKHAVFNRAAKPYLDAEKMVRQYENYQHFDEIEVEYEAAKQRVEAKRAEEEAERLQKEAEEKAYRAQLKAEKKAKKK